MAKLTGKTDGRGGARPGAGRKSIYVISEKEVKKLVKAARKKTKETGKSLAEVLIDLAYQTDDKRTALAAIRIYYDHTIVKNKESEQNVNVNENRGPRIGLPPIKGEDPALTIVKGSKE